MAPSQAGSGVGTSLLLITYSYPPVVGGSETEAQRVSAALRERGYLVRVLCAGGDPMPPVREWVDPLGTPVGIFDGRLSPKWRGRFFAPWVALSLVRWRRHFRTAYFLMQGLHVLVGVPVARLLGMRVLMKFSCSGEITTVGQSRLGRLELLILRKLAHRIMILNSGMVQEAVNAGFEESRLEWMPNPVATDEFCPCDRSRRSALRRDAGLPDAAPVVVYTGRLAPQKVLPVLLKAFFLTVRQCPEAILLLVGDGPCRAELESLVDGAGLRGSVRFVGAVDPGRVCEWLQLSDVFALTSPREGFSCSLLEAMSSGLPSVVSGIPANMQLVEDGVHGLVAEVGSEESIAQCLLRLLRDPALRARMGQAARTRVLQEYRADVVTSRYEALLGALVA
ncbi:MAG: glycosyltransferase family 4 protein [Bryobacteraceae bacterium]